MSDTTRLLMLVGGCAVLWSIESVVPLYRYPRQRFRRALPNVALTVILVLTNLAFSFLAASVAAWRGSELRGWIGLLVGVAALDFFAWLGHLAMHKSTFGWRFHRVHHSDEEVDVTTAFRQHPVESVWRILCQLPAIAIFGVPLSVVVVYLAISALNAQLEHANVPLPERFDRILRLVVVTPNMHKVHHSRLQPQTDSNYANIFSVWDRLFGTFTSSVDFAKLSYGLDGVDRQTLRGLLAMPFSLITSAPPPRPAAQRDPASPARADLRAETRPRTQS